MTDIISKPFDWNDNMSEIAQEDFSMIQKNLPYGTASSIGLALAKLEFLEKQGCKVKSQESEKYCDRNICVSNEYNGIGCDDCEVAKSREPRGSEDEE